MHIIVNNIRTAHRAQKCERARPSVPPFHPSALCRTSFASYSRIRIPPGVAAEPVVSVRYPCPIANAAEEDAADLGD